MKLKPIPAFLAEKGITSTSANHLANLAKERIQDHEAELRNLQFYNENVELLTGERKTLRKGYTDLNRIPLLINEIAKMYSFCAWVREAIRYKDNMINRLNELTLDDYCEEMGIEMPERPLAPEDPTQEDILARMSIKDRNDFFTLEAIAATFGKHIHNTDNITGDVAVARAELQKVSKQPSQLEGRGRDSVLHSFEPTVDVEQVDDLFFKLQAQYRAYEARVNSIKADINKTIKDETLANRNRFENESNEYSRKIQQLNIEKEKYVIEMRAKIGNLKIVIPDRQLDTFNMLNSLGKTE